MDAIERRIIQTMLLQWFNSSLWAETLTMKVNASLYVANVVIRRQEERAAHQRGRGV